jgi:hypothetical protein
MVVKRDSKQATAKIKSGLHVPKTLSVLMEQWNRRSWWNDWAVLFRSGRPGLAIQAATST